MTSLLLLATLVSVSVCVDVSGRVRVPPLDSCDGVVRLRGGVDERATVPLANGAFAFSDVSAGQYVLSVQFVKFAFADVRVDVGADGSVRARLADEPDAKLSVPLDLAPLGATVYYQEAQTFKITSILFHPMILMMLVMGGFSFILPKMVDKDAMKELTNAANSGDKAADSSESASAAPEPIEEAPSILLPRLTAGQQVLLNKPPPKK